MPLVRCAVLLVPLLTAAVARAETQAPAVDPDYIAPAASLAPERVRMAAAQSFESAARARAERFALLGDGRSAKLAWQMQDYNPSGAVGDAAAATPEKGRALIEAAGLQLARLLDEVSKLPLSTLHDPAADA